MDDTDLYVYGPMAFNLQAVRVEAASNRDLVFGTNDVHGFEHVSFR